MANRIFKQVVLGSNFDREILAEKKQLKSFVLYHINTEEAYRAAFGNLESSHDESTIYRQLEDYAERSLGGEDLEQRLEEMGDDPHFYSYWFKTPIHFDEDGRISSHLKNLDILSHIRTIIQIVEGSVHAIYSRDGRYVEHKGFDHRNIFAVFPEKYDRVHVPDEVFKLDNITNPNILFGVDQHKLVDLPENLQPIYAPSTEKYKSDLDAFCIIVLDMDYVVNVLLKGDAISLRSGIHMVDTQDGQIAFKCPVQINQKGQLIPGVNSEIMDMAINAELIIPQVNVVKPLKVALEPIRQEVIAQMSKPSSNICYDLRIIDGGC